MSTQFTSQWYQDLMLRKSNRLKDKCLAPDAVENESDLHAAIMAECRARRWQFLHGSMSEATCRTLGEPDFVLLCNGGRVLFIECKSRNGKLKPVQQAFKFAAELNGHTVHIVRSMTEFLNVIDTPTTPQPKEI